MTADPETIVFDQSTRRHVYDQTMRSGSPPSVAETAAALSATIAEVEASFLRLAAARMLVLQRDSAEILMASPFSAVPTPFLVRVNGRAYYGNCIWDALGIPAMLQRDAVIETSCADCGASTRLRVTGGSLEPATGIVHFAVPVAQWWADIVFS